MATCMYTTVKNTSGKALPFSYLGVHGKVLAPAAEYSEWGDYTSKFQGRAMTRKRVSFEAALDSGLLKIKKSAVNVIYDATNAVPQVATVTAGALGVADPCWGAGY